MSIPRITQGQGEYIAYYKAGNPELNKEKFEKVFEILNDYSPQGMAERGKAAEAPNRYSLLRQKVQEVDPNLEVTFIPRTLYELVFIRQVMQESLTAGKLCPYIREAPGNMIEGCWHLCRFEDTGSNNHPGVRELAFRMNNLLFKTCNINEETGPGLSLEQIQLLADKELAFLHEEYKKAQANLTLTSINYPDPTTNFRSEIPKGSCVPMGIRNAEDMSIVKDTIKLECGERAQSHYLFFREGSNNIISPSLFSGCIYDGGTSCFPEWRKQRVDGYVYPVPFTAALPKNHTIVQLCSHRAFIYIDQQFDKYQATNIHLKKSEMEKLKDQLRKLKD